MLFHSGSAFHPSVFSSPYRGISTPCLLSFWFVDCFHYLHSRGKYPKVQATYCGCFHQEGFSSVLGQMSWDDRVPLAWPQQDFILAVCGKCWFWDVESSKVLWLLNCPCVYVRCWFSLWQLNLLVQVTTRSPFLRCNLLLSWNRIWNPWLLQLYQYSSLSRFPHSVSSMLIMWNVFSNSKFWVMLQKQSIFLLAIWSSYYHRFS